MNAPLTLTNMVNQFDKWFQPIEKLDGQSIMDRLYNRLDGAYPHKWRSNFPSPEAIDNWSVSWAEAFEQEGITLQEIANGLKACRSQFEWPPSCAEFIRACRPSVDPLVAYYEAVAGVQARARGEMGVWTSPAIYWAAMPLSFDLGAMSYSQIKSRWESALHEQISRGEWPDIPQPFKQLAAPGKSDLSRESATKMIEDLQATQVIKTEKSEVDHKLWAKRIMARIKRGDKTVTLIQRKWAEEALNAPMEE